MSITLWALLVSCAGVLLGCGGGDSTGPPTIPDIAGTYEGQFTVTATSVAAKQNLGRFPATGTISQQKSNLSIVIVAPQGGAFTFSGKIAAGGAITLDDEAGLMFLEEALPQCSFSDAVATNSALPGRGRLVVTANIAGASCPWVETNGAFVATTFVMRFEGT